MKQNDEPIVLHFFTQSKSLHVIDTKFAEETVELRNMFNRTAGCGLCEFCEK
jgi:hypothetical protein